MTSMYVKLQKNLNERKMRVIGVSILILLIGVSWVPVYANSSASTMVAQYSTIKMDATTAQKNPLKTIIFIQFPNEITTVGQAIHILLLGTGYTVDALNQQTALVKNLFSQSLPVVDRKLGPMTVEQGIHILIGDAYNYRVNPVTRRISFELKSAYQKYWGIPISPTGVSNAKIRS